LKELRERNWQEPAFAPSSIDAVIITHAHIDHTGWLPRLVKLGFNGPVFTSRGTADLLKILLPDSARLQEEDADYRNRKELTRHSPALPLYDEADAKAALDLLRPVANDGSPVEVVESCTASFLVAGHILGASLVLLEMASAAFPETKNALPFLRRSRTLRPTHSQGPCLTSRMRLPDGRIDLRQPPAW
jgi:metallo-beta-lactamase family protein